MNSAVLFLVFNRPETTRGVFEAIRAARPSRLYVAADGARADRAGEHERCTEVRRIATGVDWPCDVRTLFRSENLGCKNAVSSAITWFFEHEPEGIILEDDVLPQPSFFNFCDELLERYRNDNRVSMISGCNLLGSSYKPKTSYFFSRYMHVWGWASWRRAWDTYDPDLKSWAEPQSKVTINRVLDGRRPAIEYWSTVFDRMYRQEIDTWDYQWVFAGWRDDMNAIIPARNMVRNLGFGADATHTTGEVPLVASQSWDMQFPLTHPTDGSTAFVDQLIERNVFQLGYASLFGNRLKAIARTAFRLGKSVANA